MRNFTKIALLTLIVGLGYFAYVQSTTIVSGQDSTLQATDNTGAVGQAGQQVLLLLKKVQSMSLDGAGLFGSPVFQSLQDWTVTISPQPVGRSNPFLPAFAAPGN